MKVVKLITIILSAIVFVGCSSEPSEVSKNVDSGVLYLRGTMNNWGLDHPFSIGEDTFTILVQLNEGQHELKVADSNWGKVNLGASRGEAKLTLNQPKVLVNNGINLSLTLESAGSYLFNVNLANKEAPTILVTKVNLVKAF